MLRFFLDQFAECHGQRIPYGQVGSRRDGHAVPSNDTFMNHSQRTIGLRSDVLPRVHNKANVHE